MKGTNGREVALPGAMPTADQTARYAALHRERSEQIKERWYFQPAYKYTSLETGLRSSRKR